MLTILIALVTSLIVTLIATPVFIRMSIKKSMGQFIRHDGPTTHEVKRGTPTMGGVVIILATIVGWAFAAIAEMRMPHASGWLLVGLFAGLGLIGFLDDYIKISKQRSLGLNPKGKLIGQFTVAVLFSVFAIWTPYSSRQQTPASTAISFLSDTSLDLGFFGVIIGALLFILWSNLLISAWSNAVNLTDGLDGLATGISVIVFGAYTIIAIWQSYQSCALGDLVSSACYQVRDPRDLAIFSAALVGACFGFLWWNASPAQIFMGDTGSLALGGAVAGISILSHTEILAVIIGGVFVCEVTSVVIQVICFKLTGKRVFKMAPLHHHFELKGWQEITVVIRFWIIAGLCAGLGVGLFYTHWLLQR